MELTMLENGLDFILYSIKELRRVEEELTKEGEKEKSLKYCILHLSSGIELILKSRLFKDHWTYIFSDMNKANRTSLNTGGFRSTDSNQAIDRLENLCEIKLSKEDKQILKDLRDLRNKIEHFKFNEEISSIESRVNKSLTVIIKFIQENYSILSKNEYSEVNNGEYRKIGFTEKENNLIESIIKESKELNKHYDDALCIARVKANEDNIIGKLAICPICKEKLLICEDGTTKCYLCGQTRNSEETAEEYIYSVMGINKYEMVSQGGEYPLYRCPNCYSDTLIRMELDEYQCFGCGELYSNYELEHCNDCYELTYSNHDSLTVCDICLENRNSKMEKW